jgi:hypothetical protein
MPEDAKLPDPLLAEVMADALAIQDRFIPEPMLKTTGRGVLKSRGVQGLIEDAEELRRKFAKSHAARPAP